MEKITCQKKIILDYLKSVKTHPSAEEIFQEIKKKLPRISRSTVYRILKNLKEKEEILEIPGEFSRFDGNTFPHAHFICQKCKRIFDVFNINLKFKIIKQKKLRVGKIKNYQIYFYGICKKCKK